jgi:SAM-dependent methyltransferase
MSSLPPRAQRRYPSSTALGVPSCLWERLVADLSWQKYLLQDWTFASIAPGGVVVDVGCGDGRQLQEVQRWQSLGIGIDVDAAALAHCRQASLRVARARAEQMPIRTEAVDGLLCKVVLPYTDESGVVREIARVLRPGGGARLSGHGAGYYLRYLVSGPSWKYRVYAVRALLNTWLYAASGRRLPGFAGDTVYQSDRRLRSYYSRNGLSLVGTGPAPRFLGLPVFIYHSVRKGGS